MAAAKSARKLEEEEMSYESAKRRQLEASGNATADSDPLSSPDSDNPIEFWTSQGRWPDHLFEPTERLLARKRSSSTTPSDEKPRAEKSTQYRDPRYKALLAAMGSFMGESDKGVTIESTTACMTLLTSEQTLPTESLFRDELFDLTCRSVEDRNAARVLRDITPLIVPSAEVLAINGSAGLKCLIESTNEGWDNSIPLVGIRPQPDYSVGFRRDAFTEAQLEKLAPFVGGFLADDVSFFMATYYMYFPFLACEVSCSAVALDVADRQNAHSMTLAARGIVELFRLVKREDEVHRQILSFSVSHDNCSVRIYGHYPVIDGNDTKYYRHPIYKFDFTALDGKDRWTAYRFTKNVYDTWMPSHWKRISSAVDQLPLKMESNIPALSESTDLTGP
ncbi:hypothetical protein J3F83DRAFT_677580 [Trichoderma novae-zelandiae]